MKVVSCVRGELLPIVVLYGRTRRGGLRGGGLPVADVSGSSPLISSP
jgi:hypothetical protein